MSLFKEAQNGNGEHKRKISLRSAQGGTKKQ